MSWDWWLPIIYGAVSGLMGGAVMWAALYRVQTEGWE